MFMRKLVLGSLLWMTVVSGPKAQANVCRNVVAATALVFLGAVGGYYLPKAPVDPAVRLAAPVPNADVLLDRNNAVLNRFETFYVEDSKIKSMEGAVLPGSEKTKSITTFGPHLIRITSLGELQLYLGTHAKWYPLTDKRVVDALGMPNILVVLMEGGDVAVVAANRQDSVALSPEGILVDNEVPDFKTQGTGFTQLSLVIDAETMQAKTVRALGKAGETLILHNSGMAMLHTPARPGMQGRVRGMLEDLDEALRKEQEERKKKEKAEPQDKTT